MDVISISDVAELEKAQSITHTSVLKDIFTELGNQFTKKIDLNAIQDRGLVPIEAKMEELFFAAESSGMTKAFHGTPYRNIFGSFDKKYIGTGEGGAARGWGFYLTDVLDIARDTYAKLGLRHGGGPVSNDVLERYFKPGNIVPGYSGLDKVLEFKPGNNWAVKVAKVNPSTGELISQPRWHQTTPSWSEVEHVIGEKPPAGYVYKATLHPNKQQENWLDWDEPISQQSNEVKSLLEKSGVMTEAGYRLSAFESNNHAGSLYESLKNKLGSKKAASEFLDRAGIDGIRFEAGSIMGVKPRVVERKIENISDEQADVILKELKQIPKREYGENIGFGKGKEGLMKYTKDYPSLINEIMVKHGFSNQQYNYVIFNPEHIQVDAVEEVSGKVVKEFVPNNP